MDVLDVDFDDNERWSRKGVSAGVCIIIVVVLPGPGRREVMESFAFQHLYEFLARRHGIVIGSWRNERKQGEQRRHR